MYHNRKPASVQAWKAREAAQSKPPVYPVYPITFKAWAIWQARNLRLLDHDVPTESARDKVQAGNAGAE
jgi:hypothetical protein